VSSHRLLVNTPAARLLRESDRAVLWDLVADDSRDETEITLADGRTVMIRAEAVMDAGRRIGAVVRIGPRPYGEADAGSRSPGDARPVHGWSSLSEGERSIAGLVAEGLTNREAAARPMLSPHTIDFHLRHMFGKLDVSSRVELTRVVMAHQGLMPDRP